MRTKTARKKWSREIQGGEKHATGGRLLTGQQDNFLSELGIIKYVMSLSNKQFLPFTEWHRSKPLQTLHLFTSFLHGTKKDSSRTSNEPSDESVKTA